jgi:hypothetical protein
MSKPIASEAFASDTFELRILDRAHPERRVFVICAADEIMRIASLRLAHHGALSVEVWSDARHMATVEAPD